MTLSEIVQSVQQYDCRLVEITGGEPLLQNNVLTLMKRLADAGYQILLETAGHRDISVVDDRVVRIMDIKCPSSGESDKNRWQNIEHLNPEDQVKFVIGDETDYAWAKDVIKRYELHKKATVLFSPVFNQLNNQKLAEWILADRLPVRFQVQMHKYIWHPETRGV